MSQPWPDRVGGRLPVLRLWTMLAIMLAIMMAAASLAVDVSTELRSSDPERRLIALREIAEDGGKVSRATAQRVERLLVKDPRPDIRGAAALALATAVGEDATKPLLAAIVDERDDAVAVDLVRSFVRAPPG